MIEKTNVYFLAEITRNYGNGDCILLENIDLNGNIIHALIDTGRKVYDGVVCKFLQKHKVKKLEFLLITHSHGDHNGDTISVIENYEIDKLIMKEFDLKWSPDGTQKIYEDIIGKAIQKKIKKILGISYLSLISEEYSPSRSNNFKTKLIKDAKEENFEYFNEENVNFKFGSSFIQIMNWEIFDSEGNLFVTGKTNNDKKVYRDIYPGENQNCLGVLLTQGNKKAFFAGDMNNIKKKIGQIQIGDEDRLKEKIGKINLLKLGHHGYQLSNTKDYLNVLKPEYAIITNDIGEIFKETNIYLNENNINYLYSTHDEYEVSASISNDNIELGFGTKGIKRINGKYYYIYEENIYKDYLNQEITFNYNLIEKRAKNWDELKKLIENKNQIGFSNNTCIIDALKINLCCNENNCFIANSCITISNFQKIILTTNEKEIIIKRDKTLIDFPIFYMEDSNLTLGEKDMNGIIKIDGNKKEVEANANLIKLISSELTIYDKVYLCNNLNKTKQRTKNSKLLNANKYFGSAIYANNSKMNIYGGEISNNIHEIFIDEKNKESQLPEILDNDFIYCVRGAGIYMCNNCILNMYDGKICNNQGINNSSIFSNINSTTLKKKTATIHQNCQGIGIFASKNSEIYLHKGEISNNTAINNGKIIIRKAKKEKITKIYEIFSNIYGSGIYLLNSKFEMNENFVLKNNYSELKSKIDIEKDCIIEKVINCAIRGGQIYLNNTNCKINGGLIQNSNNKTLSNFSELNPLIKKKLDIACQGGAINFINCKNIEINKLKIEKCNSDRGGAILFNNCKGKIVDSIFENNFAKGFGGGIYIANADSDFELINNKILYNWTEEGSGGGIYAFGKLIIDGENTLISDNTAGTYGGGIMIKTKGIIKNGKISHNKALTQAGGGIRIDGTLELINGKICKNWAKTKGGGINYEPSKKFEYNKENIDKIVYQNYANNSGNEIFPTVENQ